MQTNSALRLINGAAAADAAAAQALAAASPKKAARVPTPNEQAARQMFQYVSQSWGSDMVDLAVQEAYARLGQNYPVGPTGQTTGRAVWMSLNTTRLHAGMDLLLDPPIAREMAQTMPEFTLMATVDASGVFALTAKPDADFSANMTLVTATRAMTRGTLKVTQNRLQVLGVLDDLVMTGVPIHFQWVATFGHVPHVGNRIGVSLTPITPLGFLGTPITRVVTVQALP